MLRGVLTAWLARPLTSFHLVLAVFGLLTVFGLVMVLSASAVDSMDQYGSSYAIFYRQLLYCGVGLVLFLVVLRIPPKTFRRLSPLMLAVCLLLLALVLVVGHEAGGARSWFRLGPLPSFQPVEVAKVAFALWGAHVLVVKRALLSQWRHLLVPVIPVALLIFTLIMMQPDLGSTITVGIVMLALLWFAGAPLRLFAVIVLAGVTGALVLALSAPYRLDRMLSFFDPAGDPLNTGYHARQALFALADGGMLGKGLGQGSAKFSYLPNVHNDFIFAVVGEELGLVGCALVIGLFATLAYVGLRIAARNTDPWNRLVAATLTTWLVAQAAVNIGYVVGLLPVTGLQLPLMSSGGTSLIAVMIVFGMLANFARHEPEAVAALRSQGVNRRRRWFHLPLPDAYRPRPRRRPARPATQPRRPGRPTGTLRTTGQAAARGRAGRAPSARTGRRRRPRRAP
nr:putative lipid II flippase FtsW [Actinoalloteichus hoggarensis]